MDDTKGPGDFTSVVNQYVAQSSYNTCQIARLSGIPRMTLVNWLGGQSKKPRVWQDVVKLARALRLSRDEANELLHAAAYPPLSRLQIQLQSEEEQALLSFWVAERALADRPAPFQAIPDLPTFVGRQTYLETLPELLRADHHNRIYVLEGTAGVGKTALAARLAYQLRPHLPDGVLWARLDTTTPLTILRQFAEAYGRDLSGYEDLDSRSQIVRGILAHKRALMVLDNVQSSRQIQPLLPPSGDCAVLITTRHHNLSGTHGGRRFQVGPFAEAEALALFGQVLGEERVTKEQATYIAIADLLGYLSLAIDIAACRLAYEPGWTAADFLAQLQREKSLLNSLIHDVTG